MKRDARSSASLVAGVIAPSTCCGSMPRPACIVDDAWYIVLAKALARATASG